MTTLDAVVVGAGQAGLGVSYYLKQAGRPHVVFERGQVGETWLTQRWDTFRVNTANYMNALPGLPYDGPEPDGFAPQAELVDYYRRYVDHFHLPVRTGVAVVAVEQSAGEAHFSVQTRAAGQADERVTGRCVVIAAGIQNAPNIPAQREKLPQGITQVHTAAYRGAAALLRADGLGVDIEAIPTRSGAAHKSIMLRASGKVLKFSGWLEQYEARHGKNRTSPSPTRSRK